MKRRNFLKKTAVAGAVLAGMPVLGNHQVTALAHSKKWDRMNRIAGGNGKKLVIIQLDGGNDGLNTLVPIEDQVYYDKRPVLSIPKSSTLKMSDSLGWNPNLEGIKSLFDDGKATIIQGVSYPSVNRSHFRGTDIWLSASDADVFESTGWVGRYLQTQFPEYPTDLPDSPPAVQIGRTLSLGFKGDNGSLGISFTTPDEFYALVGEGNGGLYPEATDTLAGEELEFIRTVAQASEVYSSRVKSAFDKGSSGAYPETELAQSLKIVSQLIAGGLETQFYLVSLKGFDTHAGQSDRHTALLSEFSGAVKAFMDDIEQLGLADDVAAMTFSEFGRRLAENGSEGTDHGAAAPMFVFGANVTGEIIGSTPDLINLDERGDLLMQYDYRQVYASVLSQWFTTPQDDIEKFLFQEFAEINIFDNATSVADNQTQQVFALSNFPNPAQSRTMIQYTLPASAYVTLSVVDVQGRKVATILGQQQSAGQHQIPFDCGGLPVGTYFYHLNADRQHTMNALQIVR